MTWEFMSISNRIKWIEYKNKELLYIDFSGLYGGRYMQEILNLRNFVIESGRENIRVLFNASNTFVKREIIMEIQRNIKEFDSNVSKTAIVGSSKVQEIFIKFLRTITKVQFEIFDSEEIGRDWLVK